jgi:hypothetical protein
MGRETKVSVVIKHQKMHFLIVIVMFRERRNCLRTFESGKLFNNDIYNGLFVLAFSFCCLSRPPPAPSLVYSIFIFMCINLLP